MVDFSTQTRVHGYLYSPPERTDSLHSFKEQYRRNEPLLFTTARVPQHDCRGESRRDAADPKFWEALMFSHGLNDTYNSKAILHSKMVESDPLMRPPGKLLTAIGKLGTSKEEFKFPRGITTDSEGDIIVADTKNHRIQRYNSCGIYKDEFGCKGSYRGEFHNPTDVAVLDNDDIVCADSGNYRVQIFRPHGRLKHVFNTKEKTIFVACDQMQNVYCSTVSRTVEIYNSGRQLIEEFKIMPSVSGSGALPIAVTPTEEIVIADVHENKIKLYSFSGQLMHQFEPLSDHSSLGCHMSSVALNPIGQILIADALNHVINVYSSGGKFIAELLRPTDNLGCVQACAVSPEGHLVVLENSTTGPHCMKIFRYGSCACHRSRPGSSRRTTPAS